MSDSNFVFLIVGIVIAHFIFAVAYLVYKISKAPKSDTYVEHQEEESNAHNP